MSKTSTGRMVTPWTMQAIQPALYPNVWKNGGTIRYRSPARKSMTLASHPCARSDWPWVSITPFG